MARIPPLNRTLSHTIPFARGVADRAVSAAGPIVVDVVGRVTSRFSRRSRPEASTPETFSPTPVVHDVAPEVSVTETTGHEATTHKGGAPSPAMVARNAAGPRPTAKGPAKRKPRSVPGAKLPVSRPST